MDELQKRKIKVVVSERIGDDIYKQVMVKHYTLNQSQSVGMRTDDFTVAILALFNASGDYPKEKRDDAYEVIRALILGATIFENTCGDGGDIDDINMGRVLKDTAQTFKWALDRGNDFSIYVMMDE